MVGMHHTIGICYITLMNLTNLKQLHQTELALYVDSGGLPCHSSILSHDLANLPQVRDRPNERKIGFCKVFPIYTVTAFHNILSQGAQNEMNFAGALQGH